MDLELDNRTVLISGSTRGIGRAIAEHFHAEGCSVCINARSTKEVSAIVAQLGERATGFVGDLTLPEMCERAIAHITETFGRLDVLVCNLGSGSSVPPGQETPEEWQRVLNLNFMSATYLVGAAQSSLAESKGNVICISSICGLTALGAPATYSVAKAALNAFVHNMSNPLGKLGIRINAVAPGNILFPGSVWQRKLSENAEEVITLLAQNVALNTLGTPDDVAFMTTFLASPRAAFITGTVMVVDGGQTNL